MGNSASINSTRQNNNNNKIYIGGNNTYKDSNNRATTTKTTTDSATTTTTKVNNNILNKNNFNDDDDTDDDDNKSIERSAEAAVVVKSSQSEKKMKQVGYAAFQQQQQQEQFEKNNEKLEKAYVYFTNINNPHELLNDKKALKYIIFISELTETEEFRARNNNTVLFAKYNIAKLFSDILANCFDDVKTLVNKYDALNDEQVDSNATPEHKELKRKFLFAFNLTNILWQFTDSSVLFCKQFHQENGTEQILNYLSDENFVKNCRRFKLDSAVAATIQRSAATTETDAIIDENMVGIRLQRSLIGIAHNLSSKVADETKQDWHQMNATAKLLRFIELLNGYLTHRLSAYLTLANILNDKEIDTLPDIDQIVDDLVKLAKIGATALDTKENLRYTKVDINQNGKLDQMVSVVSYKDSEFNLIELLDGLYKLAVNDSIKFKIYNSFKMKQSMRSILFNGNEVEKEFCTKLMWQLCFDKRVCLDILADPTMLNYLKDLKRTNASEKDLITNMNGIMWLHSQMTSANQGDETDLNDEKEDEEEEEEDDDDSIVRNKDKDIEKRMMKKKTSLVPKTKWVGGGGGGEVFDSPATQASDKTGHIMISYNSASREMCLRIKSELEKYGYRIWIDVEDIHGSSLESMARAIENSSCVLICMTEKYKQSPNCRAEAEYTFNRQKSFIPLIMQPGYVADGWLGLIVGSKIYINFTKYTFEVCMDRLKSEIKSVTHTLGPQPQPKPKQNSDTDKKTAPVDKGKNNQPPPQPPKDVSKWSTKDVHEWLNSEVVDSSNNNNSSFQSLLEKFDGEMLEELFNTYKQAPEFYFKSISQNGQIDIGKVLKFTNKLKRLFVVLN